MDKVNTERKYWDKIVDFHGHSCGGLAIGFKAALYAMELLDLDFSEDEQVVCVSENDACGVDAIQVLLGCSIGKGNLLFHITGKQAFNFYCRKTNQSVRMILLERPENMSKEESFKYIMNKEPKELFEVKEVKINLPSEATIFYSYACSKCGEITGANWIRIQDDKKYCIDCYDEYDRFKV